MIPKGINVQELKKAVDSGTVPGQTANKMPGTVKKTADNVIAKTDEEAGIIMTTYNKTVRRFTK